MRSAVMVDIRNVRGGAGHQSLTGCGGALGYWLLPQARGPRCRVSTI